MVATLTAFCFAGFGTDRLRCKQAMKTAGRENHNPWAMPRSRAHGAADQNGSCSNRWAEKHEKLQPLQWCFFLTSPFIELIRHASVVWETAVEFGTIHVNKIVGIGQNPELQVCFPIRSDFDVGENSDLAVVLHEHLFQLARHTSASRTSKRVSRTKRKRRLYVSLRQTV